MQFCKVMGDCSIKYLHRQRVLTSCSSMAGCGRDCCGRDSAVRGSGSRRVGLCSGVPWAMSCACGLIPDLLTGDHLCTGRSHASQKDPWLVLSRHVAGLLEVEIGCFYACLCWHILLQSLCTYSLAKPSRMGIYEQCKFAKGRVYESQSSWSVHAAMCQDSC